ncbi:MAG: hypothetical protein WCI41_03650 [bacterium]
MQNKRLLAHILTLITIVFMVFLGSVGVPIFTVIGLALYIAVVCTGGIGLIVVVPALILIYRMIFEVFCFLLGSKRDLVELRSLMTKDLITGEVKNMSINDSSNNELAIIGYIVNSRKIISDDMIRINLKTGGGWNDLEIENAFSKCGPKI